jgi:di/tricarboxylate transporter
MASRAGESETRLLLLLTLLVLPVSAVINNTAAVAVLMPVVIGVARGVGIAPSRVLMPLSFAGQLGGTLTLVGTSTNLLVAGLVLDLGVERIRLFDITPPALVTAGLGTLYLLTIGRWLLPHRDAQRDLLKSYELHDYLTVLRIRADSDLVGRSLAEARFGEAYGLQVVRVRRADGTERVARGTTVLRAHDMLVVEGKIRDIARVRDEQALELIGSGPEMVEQTEDARLAEVLVPSRSAAVGRTVRGLALRARHGVSALAARRHEITLQEDLGDLELQPGDMLLVQGTAGALRRLHLENELVLLGSVDLPAVRHGKVRIAIPIIAGVVLLPALGVTTIVVSALAGVVAMFLTRCITPDEAYRDMDWMVIVLLGAILPLGLAIHESGAAEYLAWHFIDVASPLGMRGILAAFLILTTALTAIISNAAAVVVLAPVAVAVAGSLGVSALPFVIAVMIGASNSFLSPIGYQTNTMIYGPGGYTFRDYLRVGTPLSVVVIAGATFAIPVFFPFH